MGIGSPVKGEHQLEPEAGLDIKGSDPSEWEDSSFEERVRAVKERKLVIENKRGQFDPSDNTGILLYKHHERANSQSGMNIEEQVIVRERPKSLEDLNQKKGVRAKRESRRMRELEQAIFSLELLKVRSTGGVSPSEERQWSPDLVSEGMHSPQGTPESESSQGSLEMLEMQEELQNSKQESALPQEHSVQSVSRDSFSNSPKLDDEPVLLADVNRNVSDRKRSISSSELPECLASKERLAGESHNIYSIHPREPLISSSLPTFYLPPQNSAKPSYSVMENNLRNKQMAIGSKSLFMEAKQDCELEKSGHSSVLHGECQLPVSSEEGSFFAASQGLPSELVIKRLEKLNVEKEERRKQKQLQNEKQMMEQIRHEKEILEKQRKAFEQFENERKENEQIKNKESSQGTPLKSPKKTEQSFVIENLQNKEEHGLAKSAECTSSVDIKGLTVSNKGGPSAHQVSQKERTIIMILEQKEGPAQVAQESAGPNKFNSHMAAETQEGLSKQPARKERFRLPRIPSQGTESASGAIRAGSIFFNPKDTHVGIK